MTTSSFFNRVQFNATNTGTVDFHVDSAVAGYRTPAQASIPNNTVVSYVAFILSGNGQNAVITDWETGQGTYTTANVTVSRTTIRESTNNNNKVNFASRPIVILDYQAQDITNTSVTSNITTNNIVFVIDGGGSAITAGIKGDLEVSYPCTINQATLLADQAGTLVVNIWKDSYANFPPTSTVKITSTTPPTITASVKAQDATLSGWTTGVVAGDILRFNVDSCLTITRGTLSLKVTRT